MNKRTSPSAAQQAATTFIPIVAEMGRCVIWGNDLKDFDLAAKVAMRTCEQPPSRHTCAVIEECLGLMVNLFLDSPEFSQKPLHQRQLVVDMFERTGSALHEAATNITALH